MPTFPLPFKPKYDYHTGGRKFGADRAGGSRKHGGCDLIAPSGTKIYAVEDGTVVRGPYAFYHGTDAIEFKLKSSGGIVRYGEIKEAAPGIKTGVFVKEGEWIATVGQMTKSSMLHFELYAGSAHGSLTQGGNKPYMRRKDIIDPAPYLDSCKLWNVLHVPSATSFFPSFIDSIKGVLPTRWM